MIDSESIHLHIDRPLIEERRDTALVCFIINAGMNMDNTNDKDENGKILLDRSIYLRQADSGVEVVFFTLVVKMESIRRGGDGDVLSTLKETGLAWRTDGMLCSAIAMGLDDLEGGIAFLEGLGLQSKNAPVDYYVLATDIGEPYYLTHNDAELEFFRDEDNRPKVRLKVLA
jgi:hypothetical protein